jgi:hypothetical protein
MSAVPAIEPGLNRRQDPIIQDSGLNFADISSSKERKRNFGKENQVGDLLNDPSMC